MISDEVVQELAKFIYDQLNVVGWACLGEFQVEHPWTSTTTRRSTEIDGDVDLESLARAILTR